MKSAAILALLAGCSFSITLDLASDGPAADDARADVDAPAIDAQPIDAAPPIDAGPDAMATWVQVDMFDVPCIGTEVQSTTVLAASTLYRLRATGSCIANDEATIGGDVGGDAEFIWNDFSINDTSSSVDVGLAINDTTPDTEKLPRWGGYTSSHEYTSMWMGLGAAIVAKYHDPNYSNNSGHLTLHIDSFQ